MNDIIVPLSIFNVFCVGIATYVMSNIPRPNVQVKRLTHEGKVFVSPRVVISDIVSHNVKMQSNGVDSRRVQHVIDRSHDSPMKQNKPNLKPQKPTSLITNHGVISSSRTKKGHASIIKKMIGSTIANPVPVITHSPINMFGKMPDKHTVSTTQSTSLSPTGMFALDVNTIDNDGIHNSPGMFGMGNERKARVTADDDHVSHATSMFGIIN